MTTTGCNKMRSDIFSMARLILYFLLTSSFVIAEEKSHTFFKISTSAEFKAINQEYQASYNKIQDAVWGLEKVYNDEVERRLQKNPEYVKAEGKLKELHVAFDKLLLKRSLYADSSFLAEETKMIDKELDDLLKQKSGLADFINQAYTGLESTQEVNRLRADMHSKSDKLWENPQFQKLKLKWEDAIDQIKAIEKLEKEKERKDILSKPKLSKEEFEKLEARYKEKYWEMVEPYQSEDQLLQKQLMDKFQNDKQYKELFPKWQASKKIHDEKLKEWKKIQDKKEQDEFKDKVRPIAIEYWNLEYEIGLIRQEVAREKEVHDKMSINSLKQHEAERGKGWEKLYNEFWDEDIRQNADK